MSESRGNDAPGIYRRVYFLYRFQAKYALAFILLSTAIAVVIAFASFKVFDQLGSESFEKHLKWLVAAVVGLAVSSLGIFYLLVAVASQRLSAPLTALTHALAQLAAGEIPQTEPVHPTDELHETFSVFESVIDEFQSRRTEEILAFQ